MLDSRKPLQPLQRARIEHSCAHVVKGRAWLELGFSRAKWHLPLIAYCTAYEKTAAGTAPVALAVRGEAAIETLTLVVLG
jgi:hypothetical protein